MASLDFPSNPVNNQTYALNGVTYYYNSSMGAWLTQITSMNLSTSSNTQVLFNDAGLANGSTGLTYNKTANTLYANTVSVSGNITANAVSISGNVSSNTLSVTSGSVIGNMLATGTVAGSSSNMFRNRIINGAMMIDQRNAGASANVNGNDIYTVDRFKGWASGGGFFSAQQSSTAPAGFTNSVVLTVTTADASVAAGDFYAYAQDIEGYNVADLDFGLSTAKSITVSFWVRSSLTGTYGGAIYSVNANRSYVYQYTINAANTWEQKSITVSGDTSGTWLKTNGNGMRIYFDLGSGSTYQNAAGSWVASQKFSTSGNANWIGTLSNNLYITGVQLEVGTVATPFEYRHYGHELALCQRYLPCFRYDSGGNSILPCQFGFSSTTNGRGAVMFPVQTRVEPTGYVISSASHFSAFVNDGAVLTGTSTAFAAAGPLCALMDFNVASGGAANRSFTIGILNSAGYVYFTGSEL